MRRAFVIMVAICMLSCAAVAENNDDIVILYTNDVHCAVTDFMGYAAVAGLRDQLESEGKAVLLMDAGDAVSGDTVGTLSKGTYIIDIMNKMGYDVAAPGNHEFDYGINRFFKLVEMAEFPYVCCNFIDVEKGEPALNPHVILEAGGKKIGCFGILTPVDLFYPRPKYFQDEQGNIKYDFSGGDDGSMMYEIVQMTVDALRGEGADIVVAIGHLGIEERCSPWTSVDVIMNTSGIDVFIDSHSHSVIPQRIVKNKLGGDVVMTSAGKKITSIGMVTISDDGISSALVRKAPVSAEIHDFVMRLKWKVN